MRSKRPVIGRTLGKTSVFGRPDTEHPFRFFLTFEEGTGPGDMTGREVQVVLDGYELSGILGAIPVGLCTEDDLADSLAIGRVRELLRRLAAETGDPA